MLILGANYFFCYLLDNPIASTFVISEEETNEKNNSKNSNSEKNSVDLSEFYKTSLIDEDDKLTYLFTSQRLHPAPEIAQPTPPPKF